MSKNNNECLMLQIEIEALNHILKVSSSKLKFKFFYQSESAYDKREANIIFEDDDSNDFLFTIIYNKNFTNIEWSFSYILTNNHHKIYFSKFTNGEIVPFLEIKKIFNTIRYQHYDVDICKSVLFQQIQEYIPLFFLEQNKYIYTLTKTYISAFEKIIEPFDDIFNCRLGLRDDTPLLIHLFDLKFQNVFVPTFKLEVTFDADESILNEESAFILLFKRCFSYKTKNAFLSIFIETFNNYFYLRNPKISNIEPKHLNGIKRCQITLYDV